MFTFAKIFRKKWHFKHLKSYRSLEMFLNFVPSILFILCSYEKKKVNTHCETINKNRTTNQSRIKIKHQISQ